MSGPGSTFPEQRVDDTMRFLGNLVANGNMDRYMLGLNSNFRMPQFAKLPKSHFSSCDLVLRSIALGLGLLAWAERAPSSILVPPALELTMPVPA